MRDPCEVCLQYGLNYDEAGESVAWFYGENIFNCANKNSARICVDCIKNSIDSDVHVEYDNSYERSK